MEKAKPDLLESLLTRAHNRRHDSLPRPRSLLGSSGWGDPKTAHALKAGNGTLTGHEDALHSLVCQGLPVRIPCCCSSFSPTNPRKREAPDPTPPRTDMPNAFFLTLGSSSDLLGLVQALRRLKIVVAGHPQVHHRAPRHQRSAVTFLGNPPPCHNNITGAETPGHGYFTL